MRSGLKQLMYWALGLCVACARWLKRLGHWLHIGGVTAFGLALALKSTEAWQAWQHFVELAALIVLSLYVVALIILAVARYVVHPPVIEGELEWLRQRLANHDRPLHGLRTHDARIAEPEDLEFVVTITHKLLGAEHPTQSKESRKMLYQGWYEGNPSSIVLITPTFGSARGTMIGVSIILPLRNEAVSFISNKHGGIWRLGPQHIYGQRRKNVSSFLIDTLLIKPELVSEYSQLALLVLHQHLALFYSLRTWSKTTLLCPVFRNDIKKSLERRGFHHRCLTKEGEPLFQLTITEVPFLGASERKNYAKSLELIKWYASDNEVRA